MKNTRTRPLGFTLIEIMIVLLMLSIILLAVMSTFTAGQEACHVGTANLHLQRMSTRCLAEISRKLREARITAIDPNGWWIELQVPVDQDRDGDVLNDSFGVDWGADGVLGYRYRYVFWDRNRDNAGNPVAEPRTLFIEQDEGPDGIDLNRDGRKDDEFAIRWLVEEVWPYSTNPGDPAPTQPLADRTRVLSPTCVVTRRAANPANPFPTCDDINEDGIADPPFELLNQQGCVVPDPAPGINVRVSFLTYRMTPERRVITRRTTSMVGTAKLLEE